MFGRRERGELNLCLLNASVRKWDLRNLTGLYSFETEERWYYWAWYRDVNFGGEIVMLRVHGNLCWVEIVCYLLYRQHWLLESPPQAPKKYKYNFARRNEIPVLSLVIFLVKTRLKPSQTRKKHQKFPPPAVQEYIICNITDIPISATHVRGSHRSEYNISAP